MARGGVERPPAGTAPWAMQGGRRQKSYCTVNFMKRAAPTVSGCWNAVAAGTFG
jgi:hypothetical protein